MLSLAMNHALPPFLLVALACLAAIAVSWRRRDPIHPHAVPSDND